MQSQTTYHVFNIQEGIIDSNYSDSTLFKCSSHHKTTDTTKPERRKELIKTKGGGEEIQGTFTYPLIPTLAIVDFLLGTWSGWGSPWNREKTHDRKTRIIRKFWQLPQAIACANRSLPTTYSNLLQKVLLEDKTQVLCAHLVSFDSIHS